MPRLFNIRFLLRWGVFYNLELIALQALTPRCHKSGSALAQAPRAPRAPAGPDGGLIQLRPRAGTASATSPDRREMAEMNACRRRAQQEISRIVQPYGASLCANCGLCCQEPVNRFTPFDHLIQIGEARSAVDSYGTQILSLPWIVWSTVKHSITRLVVPKSRQRKPDPCRHLGTSGCLLSTEARPMLCASWFCPKYMLAMAPADIRAVEPSLREIERLHWETWRMACSQEQQTGDSGRPGA